MVQNTRNAIPIFQKNDSLVWYIYFWFRVFKSFWKFCFCLCYFAYSSLSNYCLFSNQAYRVDFKIYLIFLTASYTNADLKIYRYLCLHIKTICRRFRFITAFTFWGMHTRYIWNVCLETYRNNRMLKSSLLFSKKTKFTGN